MSKSRREMFEVSTNTFFHLETMEEVWCRKFDEVILFVENNSRRPSYAAKEF
jgi:hypothetical protein